MASRPACSPNSFLDRAGLDHVSGGGRGAVGVDVVDVARRDPGILERESHATPGTGPVIGRKGDVEGIAAHPEARHLRVDARTARARMLETLENHHPGSVRQNESVAVLVPGAARALRIVIARRQGARRREARKPGRRGRHFRSARHHAVGVPALDHPRRVPDAVRAGGAGGHDAVGGALDAIADGQVSGDHVDDVGRHEERRDLARPAGEERLESLLDAGKPADSGADAHADALRVRLRHLQPRVLDGPVCSRRDRSE